MGTHGAAAGKPIEEVVVIGAGVMGAAIAAHLANAGVRVLLLDMVPKDAAAGDAKARRRLADAGFEGARKAKPAAFFSPRFETLVRTGNLDDDLGAVAQADVVIEAIVERLDIKQALFARLEAIGGDAVITSNTSGLRIADMLAGRGQAFRERFCVTHFFNPPRYLRLVELVAGADTTATTMTRARSLCALVGKGVVVAKDTPNFIANRIGTFSMMRTFMEAAAKGYTVEEVDLVFGPAMGRPKSAIFRTADVVGLDTLLHVTRHCHEALATDERRDVFAPPAVLTKLVDNKWLGAKSKQGFFKKEGDQILQLDLASLTYKPQTKPRFASIGAARGVDDIDERLRRIHQGDDRAAALARTVTYETLIYAANRIPEIADDPADVDRAMRWGFGWQRGPFETWDALGVRETSAKMEAAGLTVPAWVKARLAAGHERFYEPGFDLDPRPLACEVIRRTGGEVERNGSASILDLGDGVFAVEFHGKMNALDPDVITMMMKAVDRAERQGAALVVGNDSAEAFSAGANLFALMVALGQGNFKAVEDMVRAFQAATMRLRRARVPTVAAPAGLCLGGGTEVVMGCAAARAHAELYLGLVEVGVGLIPAGAGSMEMAARASARALRDPDVDPLALLRTPFLTLAQGKVSTSAEDARDMGFLRETDGVSMARETLLADAKALALGLARAGHRPPPPRLIRVAGQAGAATLRQAARNLADAHQISAHDQLIAGKLAWVMCGGDVPAGALVSEAHMLDLEREAFLSLCGEDKTRARIQHMLEKGKPLRN